jgi:hypothetical protein
MKLAIFTLVVRSFGNQEPKSNRNVGTHKVYANR